MTAESIWHSCDWQLDAFSSDGRFGVGRSVMYGTIGIVDLNTDKLALGINPDMTPVGTAYGLRRGQSAQLRSGQPGLRWPDREELRLYGLRPGWSVLVLPARYADAIDFVLPNRE
jgi:hypothetical protein